MEHNKRGFLGRLFGERGEYSKHGDEHGENRREHGDEYGGYGGEHGEYRREHGKHHGGHH